MKKPFVSVVMPFFNSERFIKEAITSILNQTYDSFEFIIINDGSSDHSYEIVKEIKDPRIKLINHLDNKGNYPRRNEGTKMAKGKYVFVMDSDDWAMPGRLEAQIDALEYIPNLLACGCTHEDFNNIICYRTLQYSGLKVNLLLNNSFLHPSLAIRKDILHQINYYNEKYVYASDYDLACRLSLCGKVINLPDILMKYRAHENRISSLHSKQQTAYADEIRINYLHTCGFVLNKQQESIFTGFMKNPYIFNAIEIQELKDELHKQNSELKYFKSEYLDSLFDSSTYE